jgi:hypothetical protein
MAVRKGEMRQSRMERMEWAAVKEYLAEAEKSRDSANLRLNQVRELLLQVDDMTFEEFVADLKDILE